MWGELVGLYRMLLQCNRREVLMVWVSDAQSAVWAINKGRARHDINADLLRILFDHCDDHHIILIALWVPRELNMLADSLSHYAHSLDRREVSGRLQELRTQAAGAGGEPKSNKAGGY